jgi:hypothetical protein
MAVAAITNSQDGTWTSGQVTLVPAPVAGQNNVRTVTISNNDSASVTLCVQLLNGASKRTIWNGMLNPGDTWSFGESGDVLVLDASSKSMVATLSGTVSSGCDYVASWLNSTES